MNIKAVIGVLLALTTPMSFCLAQETEQAAPLETAQQLITAMNEGNFEAARALFAEDGYSAYGMDGTPHAGEGLDAWLQSDIFGSNARFEVTSETTCSGDTAVLDGNWGTAGDVNRPFRYLFVVEDGLIQSGNLIEQSGAPCANA